jgi:hypothetical protein
MHTAKNDLHVYQCDSMNAADSQKQYQTPHGKIEVVLLGVVQRSGATQEFEWFWYWALKQGHCTYLRSIKEPNNLN